MIFEKDMLKYECIHSEESSYRSLFTEEERQILVELIKRVFNRNFTNEKSVRLDNILDDKDMKVFMSISEFYDFLVTNFTLLNIDKLLDNSNVVERELLTRIKKTLDIAGIECFDDILKNNFLSNIIAVSCLIQDKSGRVLLTHRNNNVGIANGFLSVSVTGSVDFNDFQSKDPFIACCKREVKEELGFCVGAHDEIKLKKVVCGKKKLQPIALIDIVVDNMQLLLETLEKYKGFCEESSQYYVCNIRDVKTMINSNKYNITEAGLAHLESIL